MEQDNRDILMMCSAFLPRSVFYIQHQVSEDKKDKCVNLLDYMLCDSQNVSGTKDALAWLFWILLNKKKKDRDELDDNILNELKKLNQ